MSGYVTPEFARIEIRLSGKSALSKAAGDLRDLAGRLEALSTEAIDDDRADLIAWSAIKSTSQKLRAGN